MKRILICLALFIFISLPVKAEGVYEEHYKQSGADELKYSLTDEAREFFEGQDIQMENPDWVNKITAGNIFTEIFSPLRPAIG